MKLFVQSLPFMSNPIPIRWYIMATILHTSTDCTNNADIPPFINQDIANRVRKIMTIQEVTSLAQDLGLYESHDKLIAMLSYLHDLGEIIYCRQVDSSDRIVTNVYWLLRIFRTIIQLPDYSSGSLNIKSLYKMAEETGKISSIYINHVLESYGLDDDTKNSIINLMKNYDILCKIESGNGKDECHDFESDKNKDEYHYFVPYLLQTDFKPFDLTKYNESSPLYIGYEHDDVPHIPNGIYYCLLSSCLKQWNNQDVELCYHCAKFYLGSNHYYIIIKKDGSHIALQYCYQKLDNPGSAVLTSIYNDRPHDIIKDKLSLLIDNRMPKFKGSTIRYYVRCHHCKKLTYIESNYKPQSDNYIQCQNKFCGMKFRSQSIIDWIHPNQECENGKLIINW